MKKITFLLALMISTLGFSQVTLEDFEGTPNTGGFSGIGNAAVIANPVPDGTNNSATVLELVTNTAGDPWQGANIFMVSNYIDASTPASQPVTAQVYSTVAFTMLGKLDGGQNGAVASAAQASHTGSGWETLTFTFNESLDNTAVANGEYGTLAVFPNWNGSGWNQPPIDITIYVDNVTGFQGASTVADPIPSTAAPVPTTGDATVYSIYNDTNGYTTNFNVLYSFGTLADEPDLDPDGGVTNNALKIDFGTAGFGQGEGGPDDVSAYDFVNFNYWAAAGTPGFRFVLIDNDSGGVQEFVYQIGDVVVGLDAADIVTESWQQVSIPMSFFTDIGFDSANFFQWKVDPYEQSVANGGIVYFDNIVLTENLPLSRDEFTTFDSKVYNNPTSTQWTISTPNTTIRSVEVFNVLGKRVLSQDVNNVTTNIPAQSLASGIYIARINSSSGVKTIKLIRE